MPDKIRIGNMTIHVDNLGKLLNTPIAKGMYAGAGLAALKSLLHANSLDKKVDSLYSGDKTDKDTIVLRLPRKSLRKQAEDCTKVKREGPRSKTEVVPKKSYRKVIKPGPPKKVDGIHAMEKESWPGWPDFVKDPYREASHALLVLAAGAGSYKAVDALYKKVVDKRMRADEEAAKQEYIDALMPKNAEDDMFEKEALSVSATMALLTMLLAGSAAYTTRNVLDTRRDKLTRDSYSPPPRINKIVFKADEEGEGKEASCDQVAAAFIVKFAEFNGDIDELEQELTDMFKSAQATSPSWVDTATGWLGKGLGKLTEWAPDMTNKVIMWGLKRYPNLAKLLPNGRGDAYVRAQNRGGRYATFADETVKKVLAGQDGAKYRRGAANAVAGAVGQGLKNVGGNFANMFTKAPASAPEEVKSAALPGLAASYVGSLLAEKSPEAIEEARRATIKPRTSREVKRLIKGLDIVGEGEDAEEYIAENRARIQAAVRKLIENDQI